MGKEIERKYLVADASYKDTAFSMVEIKQGYLNRDPERTVRVRLYGNSGKITVKGLTKGIERLEFEYDIPAGDAEEMLSLCEGRVLDKSRWLVRAGDGHVWEIDEFHGDLAPLVVAEIELESVDEGFEVPSFIGTEVTGDPRYYNSSLCK